MYVEDANNGVWNKKCPVITGSRDQKPYPLP